MDNELDQKIHDIVTGAKHPMNSNQIFQILLDHGEEVTIEQVRDTIAELEQRGLLIDANLPSYYAVG